MGKITFLCLLFLGSEAIGQAANLPVCLNLSNSFQFLEDPTGTIRVEDIKNRRFDAKLKGGFFPGAIWAKYNYCHSGKEPLNIVYRDPIDRFELFVISEEGAITEKFLFEPGSTFLPDFWIRFRIKINGCKTLLFRVQSGDVINFNILLLDEKNYQNKIFNHTSFFTLYYFLIFLVFGISTWLFFRTKQVIFLYFDLILIFQDFLGASLLNGYLFRFVLKPIVFVNYDVGNIFAPLMNASMIIFSVNFLEVKNALLKKISYLFIASQVLAMSAVIVNLFRETGQHHYLLSELINYSILFSCGWSLFLAFFGFNKKRNQLYMLMSGSKVLGQFTKTLLLQGDIRESLSAGGLEFSFLMFYSSSIGTAIECLGIIITLLVIHAKNVREKNAELLRSVEQLQAAEHNRKLFDTYRKVAHDIRSPLTALDVISSHAMLPPDYQPIFLAAVRRIRGLADDLVEEGKNIKRGVHNTVRPILISHLVHTILLEKRFEYNSFQNLQINHMISPKDFFIFGLVEPSQLERILSNLINNAIEAGSGSCVTISLTQKETKFLITVEDTGKGIPSEIIENLGVDNFTFGKSNNLGSGSGIGVTHARELINRWGGKLAYKSKLGVGTKVTIELPISERPSWLVQSIRVPSEVCIVIVDDDPSVHELWFQCFREIGIETNAYRSPSECQQFLGTFPKRNTLFLVDYRNRDDNVNGLEFIVENKLAPVSILVTSYFDEEEVLRQAIRREIRVLPKFLIPAIDILLEDTGFDETNT